MRKLLFLLVFLLLYAASGAAAAATYLGHPEFEFQGFTHESIETKFVCWGLVGTVIGYILGSMMGYMVRSKPAKAVSAHEKFAEMLGVGLAEIPAPPEKPKRRTSVALSIDTALSRRFA